MRHIFIINPTAGKRNCTAVLMEMAKGLETRHGLQVECILTKSPGYATEAVRAIADSGEAVRFYACGGDGTANEVANGVVGRENAAMTCIPVGTGNDFLKNFGDKAPLFADPENLWDGPQFPLDAIECNGRCALTIACSGFDAQVADGVHKYGKHPLLGGKGSYIASLAVNFLLRDLGHPWSITLDGETITGEFVLASVCNGRYYGGGFMPVAEARMDDGVLHTLIVKKVSRPTFLQFVSHYAKGEYYHLPRLAKCYRAGEVAIESHGAPIVTCLDGEIVTNQRVVLRLASGKVNFFGPAGCDPNATARPLPERFLQNVNFL